MLQYITTNIFPPPKLYKDLDDCFSVLIDSKIISKDEIEKDLIKYYETNIKNNPFTIQQLTDYQTDNNYEK